MRTVIRRVFGGVLAYLVTYALIGLLTVPRMTEYLDVNSKTEISVLQVYRGGGEPL